MPSGSSPDKQAETNDSPETAHLVVTQPEKFQGLLDTISLMDKVSERMGEDRSGDMGSSGSGAVGSSSQGDDNTQSARAQAIANLPELAVMRSDLSSYIQKEIKVLRKQVRRKAYRASKPGSAHQLNELYGKIRRLNSLLSELMEASVDVLKRIFIRVFIDRQSL
ncbi:MAG: hypothetical protein KC680_03205 [Candidatus Peregrinibacteria bacterium]|nr:hypothetical protein [Candidatus Peregrinibacteria bacterium]MCB9808275.1 hypothetical protein [Candidatus Peribacteria bacterium]